MCMGVCFRFVRKLWNYNYLELKGIFNIISIIYWIFKVNDEKISLNWGFIYKNVCFRVDKELFKIIFFVFLVKSNNCELCIIFNYWILSYVYYIVMIS